MASSTGTITIEPASELIDLVERLEAMKVALAEVGPDSKIVITSPKPLLPVARQRLKDAASKALHGAEIVVLEDGLSIQSTVERYAPAAVAVKCGDARIDSDGHGTWTLSIDGKPVERTRKLVLTLECATATLLEVTTIPDYHKIP